MAYPYFAVNLTPIFFALRKTMSHLPLTMSFLYRALSIFALVFVFAPITNATIASKNPILIDDPYLLEERIRPMGTDHHDAGLWYCFVRGDRFNMATESRGKGYRATLIMSLHRSGGTNMRISIWSPTPPPADYPEDSNVTVFSGEKKLHLRSQNKTQVRLTGYGYEFNLVSSSPLMVNQIRSLMLSSDNVSFILGNNNFDTRFSMDGFGIMVNMANEWFYGKEGISVK